MDRGWGNFGTVVSANLACLVGSGERVRHCDPVDLRCLQVEGWWPSLFPRRNVSARTDRARGGDALDSEGLGIFGWHPVDFETRNFQADDEVLLRPDHRRRFEPVRDSTAQGAD